MLVGINTIANVWKFTAARAVLCEQWQQPYMAT